MEYAGKGIYNSKGKSVRIMGETGGVSNSRRDRTRDVVGSKYKVGNASDHKWSLGASSEYGRGLSKSIKAPRKLRSSKRRGR